MTTEEFGEKYLNENILEIFDETCEFFTDELPQEFIENYDVGEVILETKGHKEEAKNFDNVLKFRECNLNSVQVFRSLIHRLFYYNTMRFY